jgi:hypothetical protein|tara:strand:- start:428 stop:628 length:201 start_codon:yes stop_codon:yes gene_type:complete
MIQVPIYSSGYPCKCNGSCDYSKAYEDAGMPKYIDYEKYIKKDFKPLTTQDILIDAYLKTKYCLKK